MFPTDSPSTARVGFDTEGKPALLVFLEADCPTCRLGIPYLNRLARHPARVIGISQDSESLTRQFVEQTGAEFPILTDADLALSRHYDPESVPTLMLLDGEGHVLTRLTGFDKQGWNTIAGMLGSGPIADPYDGAPALKPGCMSRHREAQTDGESAAPLNLYAARAPRASRITLADEEDPDEYAMRTFGDALPVVPPTATRVERFLRAAPYDPADVIGLVPPCYGAATVEKIAANAVMAGCAPEMMRVLVPLVRAACDERLNLHGVQATTHFAAPLVIVNGPIRTELGLHSRQNVFSNVARANSTLGRALQLILLNLGGARPGGIDMSTLGNPGKFSYCIAENEEENPWEPLHVTRGFRADQSTVTLYAGEAPHGVSDHKSRTARGVLKTISYALATVWSYYACLAFEAMVVLSPEHARTIHRDGFSKRDAVEFLFENTGIPLRCYEGAEGEGVAQRGTFREITIDGEPCYQKFRSPDSIRIVVAGGTAGKFSAVIGSWATGPRGSQMVTYPV